jgi:hypothetical protein
MHRVPLCRVMCYDFNTPYFPWSCAPAVPMTFLRYAQFAHRTNDAKGTRSTAAPVCAAVDIARRCFGVVLAGGHHCLLSFDSQDVGVCDK